MRQKPDLVTALQGKTIALPESRQLDVLTALFERRGALVRRIPLVSILDAPDPEPIRVWLAGFCQSPPDYFVILTGEGLSRLRTMAERMDLLPRFVDALKVSCKICRGPKPERVLKQMELKADLFGATPTTAGIIETLGGLQLRGARVAVQLYGDDPNQLLMDYLHRQNLAACSVVAPYVYANDSDTNQVKELILKMSEGEVDLIAFTSQPQIRRLLQVASQNKLDEKLRTGMARTKIAAVGPVIADVLRQHQFKVDVMPAGAYFMKPLVRAVVSLFEQAG